MTDPIPDEAVEAAIAALDDNPHWVTDLAMVQTIVHAAAPIIRRQVAVEIARGCRDEGRIAESTLYESAEYATGYRVASGECAAIACRIGGE